jgi:plastocyanin
MTHQVNRLLLVLSVVFGGVTPASPAHAAEPARVILAGTQFLPQVLEVAAGQGISWENREPANYPVVLGSHNILPDTAVGSLPGNQPFPAESPLLNPGDGWSCTGDDSGLHCTSINGETTVIPPGRYAYLCGIHPNQMHGLIVVS